MLVLPMALGLATAGRLAAPAGWVAVGMLLLFLVRSTSIPAAARLVEGRAVPPGFLARRVTWTALYGAGAAACLIAAFAGTVESDRTSVLLAAIVPMGLGAVHAALGIVGRDRTLAAEIVGMAGLASAAPLVVAASGAPLDRRAAGAGALALAYFLSSLAFVRAYRRRRTTGRIAVAPCAVAHAAIVAALVLLWRTGSLPALALAAFAPVVARTAWGLARPPRNLAELGWREVGVAAIFAVAASAALAA